MKKAYFTPELTVHGNVEKITLAGSLTNSDQNGTPDSANCPFVSDPGCSGVA